MKPDFIFIEDGPVVILFSVSDVAKQWTKNNLTHAPLWGDNGVVIEGRFFQDICDAIKADGLEIMYA